MDEISRTNPTISCGVCHRTLKYKDLIVQPSWNGKYDLYLTPCCHTEQWMTMADLAKQDKYLFRMTHLLR